MNILVIIPVFNEAMNIENTVSGLTRVCSDMDYVIVNDGSKDNTADIIKRNNYNCLNLPVNVGLHGALQTGFKYASVMGCYDAIVQFDGDGQHNPEFIYTMVNEMRETGADIVIASRFKEENRGGGLRMLGSFLISHLIKLTTGQKITDPTSGMRMFKKNIIDEFAWSMNYGPEPDTVAYLIKNGAKVSEIQATMNERVHGESYLNFTRSLRYMMHMCVSITFIQFFRKRAEKA